MKNSKEKPTVFKGSKYIGELQSEKLKGKTSFRFRIIDKDKEPLTKWHNSRHGALTELATNRAGRLEKEGK